LTNRIAGREIPKALEVAKELELEMILEGVSERPEVFSLHKRCGTLLDKYFSSCYDEEGEYEYDNSDHVSGDLSF